MAYAWKDGGYSWDPGGPGKGFIERWGSGALAILAAPPPPLPGEAPAPPPPARDALGFPVDPVAVYTGAYTPLGPAAAGGYLYGPPLTLSGPGPSREEEERASAGAGLSSLPIWSPLHPRHREWIRERSGGRTLSPVEALAEGTRNFARVAGDILGGAARAAGTGLFQGLGIPTWVPLAVGGALLFSLLTKR